MMKKMLACCVVLIASLVHVVEAQPARRPPPPPQEPAFDPKGWVLLGERTVDGRVDTDRIDLGKELGSFKRLTIKVDDGDLEMIDVAIQFKNGGTGPQNWHPDVKHHFRAGQRTRSIDLPGENRTLRWIDFKYRNLQRGSRAKVSVWGFRAGDASTADPQYVPNKPGSATRPPMTGSGFDPKGWVPLGETVVRGGGRVNKAKINIGKEKGAFSRMTLVIEESDLEMEDFAIQFINGGPGPQNWHPELPKMFREGDRTRAIDLPGKNRTIRFVELKFRNLPGGGRAKVAVWGWRAGDASTADPQFKPVKK